MSETPKHDCKRSRANCQSVESHLLNLLRRLSFNLWYLRRPPWDSGIVPPEVEDYLTTHHPGRALDLGCGTGTSTLALAQAGWQVTGVDFAPRAIAIARRKLRLAKVPGDLRVDDVTRLHDISGPFDLVLDIGCFHGLSKGSRAVYLDNLDRLLAPGGYWLMYGFFKSAPDAPGPGLATEDPGAIAVRFRFLWRKDGFDKKKRPSAWFLFQRNAHPLSLPRWRRPGGK